MVMWHTVQQERFFNMEMWHTVQCKHREVLQHGNVAHCSMQTLSDKVVLKERWSVSSTSSWFFHRQQGLYCRTLLTATEQEHEDNTVALWSKY